MSIVSYTAEAVQEAITYGPITEAYHADPQQIVQELNQLRAEDHKRPLSAHPRLCRGDPVC